MDRKYAIFDMDGTLVDSMAYWQDVALEYLDSRGIAKELQTPELMERIKTQTAPDTAALFKELFGIEESIPSIVAQVNRFMALHYQHDIRLKPGVEGYLKMLCGEGVHMCVASATTSSLIDACLTRLGARRYFDFLISCEDVGKSKTHPDVYLEAARRLGASTPQEVAVFEDSIVAAKTAEGAGFYVVGVYDACSDEDWQELQQVSDETITDWSAAIDHSISR